MAARLGATMLTVPPLAEAAGFPSAGVSTSQGGLIAGDGRRTAFRAPNKATGAEMPHRGRKDLAADVHPIASTIVSASWWALQPRSIMRPPRGPRAWFSCRRNCARSRKRRRCRALEKRPTFQPQTRNAPRYNQLKLDLSGRLIPLFGQRVVVQVFLTHSTDGALGWDGRRGEEHCHLL
jgi:hypothetical protein